MKKIFKEVAIYSEWLTIIIDLLICRSCTSRSKGKFIIILLTGEAEAPILVITVRVAID